MDDFKKYKPKKIESKQPIISILPGSRKQEISKILAKVLKFVNIFQITGSL